MFSSIHDPSAALTWWDEQSLPLLQCTFVAFVHLVGEEHFTVIGRWSPALVQRQVGRRGLDEEKDLFSLQDTIMFFDILVKFHLLWGLVKNDSRIKESQCGGNWFIKAIDTDWGITLLVARPILTQHTGLALNVTNLKDVVPNRGAAALDMEVCVAVFDTDETVFCDFWLPKQGVVRPVVFYPRQPPHNLWTLHHTIHPVPEKHTEISSMSFPDWQPFEPNVSWKSSCQTPPSVTESVPCVGELQVDDI